MSTTSIVAGLTLSNAAISIEKSLPAYYTDERERQAMSMQLLQHAPQLSRTNYLLDRKVRPLADTEACWLRQALDRLALDEPIQYVIGKVPFGPLELSVGPGVLIPRPETAELCDLIVSEQRHINHPLRLLDVGCGTACIPLYIGHAYPSWALYAMDLSLQALAYAEENACSSGIPVQLLQGDLFAWCEGLPALPQFILPIDLLTSNPPYIPMRDQSAMRPNVLRSEPAEALFVPNEDPLRYYRALITLVPRIKSSQSPLTLYCETHHELANEVAQLCWHAETCLSAQVFTDLSGRERFVKATFR